MTVHCFRVQYCAAADTFSTEIRFRASLRLSQLHGTLSRHKSSKTPSRTSDGHLISAPRTCDEALAMACDLEASPVSQEPHRRSLRLLTSRQSEISCSMSYNVSGSTWVDLEKYPRNNSDIACRTPYAWAGPAGVTAPGSPAGIGVVYNRTSST
ncbi:uncharacterized protein B0I36DRAFT_68694 [Microdochium trichocladiopsis]|uniref:Uncharacterized protein n=1 Tax=Microdochium trichocladiopsis TaxID=1682393 RepID=A0A9P8YBF7_9PEZI|nr:uncharacterized protein B0I36DRAFT_68694 [Microdochium trichocladiopsis]KAH7037621.1 hypothetical protein B0I36DRAFT_68694 [Microdochium trichocladiopsis]